jgi:hypothetical protein
MGVLEAIAYDGASASITVAGQSFSVSADETASLAVGDYIVAGATTSSTALVYHVGLPYVAGVSSVRIKGPVASVNPNTAKLIVGGLTVDYVQVLSAQPAFAAGSGQTIEAVGVQPGPGQPLLVGHSADGISVIDTQSAVATRQ